MRKIAILLILALLCASAVAEPGEKGLLPIADYDESYYMLAFFSDIEYWQRCYSGFKKAAELYDARAVFDGIVNSDSSEYAELIRSIVAKKPSGIAIAATSSQELAAAIQEAVDAGIPVLTYDQDSPDSGRICNIGIDNYAAASAAAAFLADRMEHRGEIAILSGNVSNRENSQQIARLEGFVDYIEKYEPGIRIVAVESGQSDTLKTAQITLDILQKHPDIRGLYATSAQMTSGIAAAIQEMDMGGVIQSIGYDVDKASINAIREGALTGTIFQENEAMGFWAFQILFMLHNDFLLESWQAHEFQMLPSKINVGFSILTDDEIG